MEEPAVVQGIDLFEHWLEAQLRKHDLPGVTVGIVSDQDLVYARGFGFADLGSGIQSSPESVYRIASHSKLFTAIAVLQLRDAGLLQLDDPLEKHLPWFHLRDRPADAPTITLRQILTHTAGLPREAGSAHWVDLDFPTDAELRERVPGLAATYAPDDSFKYSNLGLGLAGAVVHTVSAETYPDYVQRHILDPLGLESTSVGLSDALRPRLATGYGRRGADGTRAPFPFVDARSLDAATGLSMSVSDMARFVSWQIRLRDAQEPEVLRPSTLREMQRVHRVLPDWSSGWGLGFSVVHTKDRDLVGHGGSYPGYLTSTLLSAEEKLGVIVFANSLDAPVAPGAPASFQDRVWEWVVPAMLRARGPEPAEPDPSWQTLCGRYESLWGVLQAGILNGKLVLYDPAAPDPTLVLVTLEPLGEQRFRYDGPPLGPKGEDVTFEFDGADCPVRLVLGDTPMERTGD